jgi:hypothetical protein
MPNASSEGFSEYLVVYFVRNKHCADSLLTEMWASFSSDGPLFPAEIVDLLSDLERDRGCAAPQVVLRYVAVLHSLNQPQPQLPYWEWCKQQGLSYSQFDVLQSGTVIAQRPSSTTELFILGQMLAYLTFYGDRM